MRLCVCAHVSLARCVRLDTNTNLHTHIHTHTLKHALAYLPTHPPIHSLTRAICHTPQATIPFNTGKPEANCPQAQWLGNTTGWMSTFTSSVCVCVFVCLQKCVRGDESGSVWVGG